MIPPHDALGIVLKHGRPLGAARKPLVEALGCCLAEADLVAGGKADGVIAVPANVLEIAAGALVEFRPWRPFP